MSSNHSDRIVVPTDFSEGARRALAVAVKYAKVLPAGINLVHVYPMLPPGLTDPFPGPVLTPPPPMDLPVEIDRRLGEIAATVAPGIDCATATLEGRGADEIVAYAEQISAELIVMGTHGRTGLRRALLGSVAGDVIAKAHCPVMVVPPAAEREPR